MTDTVLVFGGSGFIGTQLIRRLVADGSRVISVDLRPERETLPGVDYRRGDVRDLAGLEIPAGVSRIYNLAAVHTTPGHPTQEYYETNVLGALEVTRLAETAGISEIVFTSSISVYGPGETTKDESSPPQPVSAYGYSKLIAERTHRQWLDRSGDNRLVIVRPAVVFGPGEGGNFTRLASLVRNGVFVYPGRKDTIKACIYVDDLLDSIEFARARGKRFVLFNGCYPQRYTLEQVVSTLIANHFPRSRTVLVPKPVVMAAVRGLHTLGSFGIGIHPERVSKLVNSTDIFPGWLTSHGKGFPDAIASAFDRWARASGATFK